VSPVCALCGKPIDPSGYGVYRRVTGWERKAAGQNRRGGSDIVLRQPLDELAHGFCVDRTRDGVNVNQETLV
jgi:hypothetical protein